MAVITADGIVGKVRDVFPHTAQVLAINDQTSGAGVILESTRIRGILRGNAAGQPQIVGILADQRIQPGEKVLTAGGDQIFPRGLPVGVVEKVVRDPERDSFINVIVKPAAHLNRLDEVLIITSHEPRFPPEQPAGPGHQRGAQGRGGRCHQGAEEGVGDHGGAASRTHRSQPSTRPAAASGQLSAESGASPAQAAAAGPVHAGGTARRKCGIKAGDQPKSPPETKAKPHMSLCRSRRRRKRRLVRQRRTANQCPSLLKRPS